MENCDSVTQYITVFNVASVENFCSYLSSQPQSITTIWPLVQNYTAW